MSFSSSRYNCNWLELSIAVLQGLQNFSLESILFPTLNDTPRSQWPHHIRISLTQSSRSSPYKSRTLAMSRAAALPCPAQADMHHMAAGALLQT